ncbi:hypothetical protein PVAND_008834 [Polypedilum vanderplanki]|uniref:Uncharacterized protein n=1 Tax=Polypedilum vanderplanki TaxID=319348 RepID=A0A9J6CCA6_POLVA|nr:hypothetical protein PVAND_008834 [Polypedilum vanderplanki]
MSFLKNFLFIFVIIRLLTECTPQNSKIQEVDVANNTLGASVFSQTPTNSFKSNLLFVTSEEKNKLINKIERISRQTMHLGSRNNTDIDDYDSDENTGLCLTCRGCPKGHKKARSGKCVAIVNVGKK